MSVRSKSSMFTIRPSPGRIEPSLATFERLVGNLIQRAPFEVPGYGRPMSLAHASGTTGSTTIFVFGGTFATSQARGRVGGPEHRGAPARQLREADDRPGREDACDREHRQEPAPEEALLRAHEQHVEDRRRDEDEREPAGPDEHPERAESARDQGNPPEPPRERPHVVKVPGGLRQAELA